MEKWMGSGQTRLVFLYFGGRSVGGRPAKSFYGFCRSDFQRKMEKVQVYVQYAEKGNNSVKNRENDAERGKMPWEKSGRNGEDCTKKPVECPEKSGAICG